MLAGCSLVAMVAHDAKADIGDGNWYFFGDSNIGQGNYSAIAGEQGEDFFPYSSNNGFQRDTNGLIWAELMGRDVDILLDPDLDSDNINFAISGAHMTYGGDLLDYGIETGVRIQTEAFTDLVDNDIIQPSAEDVGFMIAGSNDFIDRLEAGENADVISADVIGATLANIEELANAGLKTVIVSEIQPMHYAPLFGGEPELQSELSAMVQTVNTDLHAAIENSGLKEDINIVTLKYGALFDYLRSNKDLLGFDNIDEACYDDEEETLCATDAAGQNRYLFLDELHMTGKAQEYIARWWSATLSGASGNAARTIGRAPDTVQYTAESLNNRFAYFRGQQSDEKFNMFADVFYGKPKLKGLGANPTLDYKMKGALIGGEVRFHEALTLGGGLSYTDNTARFNDGSRFGSKTKALHAWADYEVMDTGNFGDLTISLGGTYGDVDVDNFHRETGLPKYAASGKTGGHFWNASAGIASTYKLGVFKVRFDGSYNYGRTTVNGFTETGAEGLALAYEKQRKTSQWLESNTRIEAPALSIANGLKVIPFAGVQWRHALKEDGYEITSQLINNSAASSSIQSEASAKNRYGAEAGVRLKFNSNIYLTARYNHTWADDISKGSSFNLGVSARF